MPGKKRIEKFEEVRKLITEQISHAQQKSQGVVPDCGATLMVFIIVPWGGTWVVIYLNLW